MYRPPNTIPNKQYQLTVTVIYKEGFRRRGGLTPVFAPLMLVTTDDAMLRWREYLLD